MNDLLEHECSKKGCKEPALALLVLKTDEGLQPVYSCTSHLLTLSSVLENIVSSIIEEGLSKEPE